MNPEHDIVYDRDNLRFNYRITGIQTSIKNIPFPHEL